MRAIVVTASGPALRDDVPQPIPGPSQVLVRVRAAGLNRADLAVASDHGRVHPVPDTSGRWSSRARCGYRSTASSRSPRPQTRSSTCAPTGISARSC